MDQSAGQGVDAAVLLPEAQTVRHPEHRMDHHQEAVALVAALWPLTVGHLIASNVARPVEAAAVLLCNIARTIAFSSTGRVKYRSSDGYLLICCE